MPVAVNYPGVYVQELPSAVRQIVGVPTAVAAFYGRAPQGQVDYPYQVNSWADYENEFGGVDRHRHRPWWRRRFTREPT